MTLGAIQAMISAKPVSWVSQPRPRLASGTHLDKVPLNRRGMVLPPTRASKDFDEVLIEVANKFERADNKVAIIGWTAAAFSGVVIAEWFIHLPLFDFLLGFPIQFLGLLTGANYGLRLYKKEKVDLVGNFEQFVGDISKELPGLGK